MSGLTGRMDGQADRRMDGQTMWREEIDAIYNYYLGNKYTDSRRKVKLMNVETTLPL